MSLPPVSSKARGPAGNYPAYVGLCYGLASLVPWVILLTLPMALVLGVIGLVKSTRLPAHAGRTAALMGMGIAVASALFQLALVGLAAALGSLFG
jgi:hypothetical protein